MLEIDCHHTEEKLKEKQSKNENLHEEITAVKNQVFDFNLQNKKLLEENRSMALIVEKYENERKTILDKYNSLTEEMEKVYNLLKIEFKFKNKCI